MVSDIIDHLLDVNPFRPDQARQGLGVHTSEGLLKVCCPKGMGRGGRPGSALGSSS